jgi:hypothetical protein
MGVADMTATTATSLTTTAAIEKIWYSDRVAASMGTLLLRLKEINYLCERNSGNTDFVPYDKPEFKRLCDAQQAIYNDESSEGDCAVIQAFTELDDSSGAEDTMCAVFVRGPRMLPILAFALDHPIYIDLKSKEEARKRLIRQCQDFIKKNPNYKSDTDCEGP